MKGFSKALCLSHLQSNTAQTFNLTSSFHTATTIYPSVTPISAKLAPFISKAAVRDTYYTETLSLDTHTRTHSRISKAMTTLFLNAVKTLVKLTHSSFRLTTLLLCEEKGQASWDVGITQSTFYPKSFYTLISSPKNRFYCGASLKKKKAAVCYSTATFIVVIISLTMMTVKILQLPVKTHK